MQTLGNSRFGTTGFHHIALKVRDFDKSVKLYNEVLGFGLALSWGEAPERGCMVDMGDGTYIEIFEGGTADGELPPEPMIHFAVLTEQCDEMYNAALAAGCKINMEPVDYVIKAAQGDMPIRISFVVGYDGELVEFFQYR